MNYTQLAAAIRAYTENDFPDTIGTGGLSSDEQIDTFIREAEQRVFNRVQLLDLRKNVTGSCTAGNKYLSVPTDWLANFSLAVIDSNGNYEYLLNKDVSFIRQSFPNPTDTGLPYCYAYFDQNSYILGPTPDDNYAVELHYFYYPESIVDAGTSWLGDNFDSVLLYGSLLEAYTFMKGEADVIAEYQKRYDEALSMLKALGEGKNRQDMYRTQQVRYPVK
ncbi:MAG: phage adaptor protein [Fluviibacter sp.]